MKHLPLIKIIVFRSFLMKRNYLSNMFSKLFCEFMHAFFNCSDFSLLLMTFFSYKVVKSCFCCVVTLRGWWKISFIIDIFLTRNLISRFKNYINYRFKTLQESIKTTLHRNDRYFIYFFFFWGHYFYQIFKKVETKNLEKFKNNWKNLFPCCFCYTFKYRNKLFSHSILLLDNSDLMT